MAPDARSTARSTARSPARPPARQQPEIFVGVDSSDCSRAALRWAAGLARRLGYRLHVVEAWEYPRDTVVRIGRVELPSPDRADELLLGHLGDLVREVMGEQRARVARGTIEVGARDRLLTPAGAAAQPERTAGRGPTGAPPAADATGYRDAEVARADTGVVGSDAAVAGSDAEVAGDDAGVAGSDAEVAGDDRELDVTIDVLRGPASEAILHAADERARMIVVGSRGLGGFRGLMLGSVSRQLCEHAPCPVTVVRSCAPDTDLHLDTIAVGVDGSVNAQRAVRFAAELAEGTGAYVVAVHAAAPGTAIDDPVDGPAASRPTLTQLLEGWCRPLERRGLDDHDLVVAEGDPRTALVDVAEERGADLIVVGSRGLGPVSKLVLGSVASSLVQHSPVPVTVVPPSQKR